MYNVIDAIQRTIQAVFVTNITNKKANARVTFKLFSHVPLLHLIARINDQSPRIVLGQSHRHEGITERPSTARNKN
ncbi:hypothetical protein D9M72_612430 [compost metagenome]